MANADVWFFFPASKTTHYAELRKALKSSCEKREWVLVEVATTYLKLPFGRVLNVVPPAEATGLYRRLHRGKVGVVSAEPAEVCKRPRPEDVRKPGLLVGLERFCRYKAFFMNRLTDPLQAWLDAFAAWCSGAHCRDELDPRCLPFHVFGSVPDFPLDDDEGRRGFDERHGHGRRRTDDEDMRWELGAYHGFEVLEISGMSLPRGFHWDVSPSSQGRRTLYTTAEEWMISEYANVGPDASVRANKKAHARRVFPKA